MARRARIVRNKVAVGRDHDEVEIGFIEGCRPGTPAEVNQVCCSVSLRLQGAKALEELQRYHLLSRGRCNRAYPGP